MSGQDQPPVPVSPVEHQKTRSQQRPRFDLNDQQDDPNDRLDHNDDREGHTPRRRQRWQKSNITPHGTMQQEQQEQEPQQQWRQKSNTTPNRMQQQEQWSLHPDGIKINLPKRPGFRNARHKSQTEDKVVAEIDEQDEIKVVHLKGTNSGVVSSNAQLIVENEQQQQQSDTAKKSKKRRSKKKNAQKNDASSQAHDPQNQPDEHAKSTDSPVESFGNPEVSPAKAEKSMAKLEQPPVEESDITTSTDNRRKEQKKKKSREKKDKSKGLKEADGPREVLNTDGSEKQKEKKKAKNRKVVAAQQDENKEGDKAKISKSNKKQRTPEKDQETEGSKEQKSAEKALELMEMDEKANKHNIIEETGPIVSKSLRTVDVQTEKNRKLSSFITSRVQALDRNRNIPIEITVYSPVSQKHRHKENILDEALSYVDGDLGEIHFATGGPDKKFGIPGRKFVDQEFGAADSADRVLSELSLESPKKQKGQQKETSQQQQRQPVSEKQRSTEHKSSKSHESYVHPDDRDPRHSRLQFSPYLSPELMEQEIQNGKLIRGVLRINKRNRTEAYVVPDTLDSDIFISGQRSRNRALDGDVVVVRMLDADKIWEKRKDTRRKKEEERDKAQEEIQAREEHENGIKALSEEDKEFEIEFDLNEGDTSEEVNEDKDKPKYAGEIVGILDRSPNQTYAGTLSVEMPGTKESDKKKPKNGNKNKEIRLVWFKPTDKRNPIIAIPIGSAPQDLIKNQEKYSGILFTARIVRWSIDSLHPFGRVVAAIGPVGSVTSETQAILSDNNVKDVDFPDVVLKGLPKAPWSIPAKEYEKRRDLRDVRIFTIDPATAKDLDDAVHVKCLDNGTYEVGVHIADVSYFVKNHTPLNTEARERGTSTYLVDRVIPMLPSLLCEQLCSLNPSVERLAFSVIWKMDEFGNILDTWFGRTIIKSCAKLAYDDAQSVIEGNGLPSSTATTDQSREDVEKDIMYLYKLSKHLRKRRFEEGALSINSIRLCFELDDGGEPKSVWVYELKEANRLIEEFMLCANMSVAQKITSHYPDEALLRRHAPPLEKRLNEFLQLSENLGYHLDGSSAGTLQASFNAIESEQAKAVLTILAIKPMQRAKYFCTGAIDIAKYSHYALNVPLYTHFTSPIRRYADIIVHRLLDAALRGEAVSGYDTKTVQKIALDCNRKSDGAKNAQDQNIQLYLARYLHTLEKTSGPIIRSGVVVQVTKEAFDVIVPEYGIEKRIPLDTLPIKKSKLDPSNFSLSIYWQKGVPVPSREDGSPTFTLETTDNDNESCPSLPIVKPSQVATLPNETYDPETGMQQLKVFTKFDVLIQAITTRSPPIINVYPINPYV